MFIVKRERRNMLSTYYCGRMDVIIYYLYRQTLSIAILFVGDTF